MNEIFTIIKEIEQYFLNISQKGLMLSSRDYHLITEWIEKGITKEHILKGIRNTFQNKDNKTIRNLADCREFIEKDYEKKDYSEKKSREINTANSDYLIQILNNFKKIIKKDSNGQLSEFYMSFNEKLKYLINSDHKDMFLKINSLEEEFFLEYPKHLDSKQFFNFKTELNKFITHGNAYINENAKNKALNNYSKNFIIDNYLGFNPFEL